MFGILGFVVTVVLIMMLFSRINKVSSTIISNAMVFGEDCNVRGVVASVDRTKKEEVYSVRVGKQLLKFAKGRHITPWEENEKYVSVHGQVIGVRGTKYVVLVNEINRRIVVDTSTLILAKIEMRYA